jgi:hypothetical protein
MANARRSTNQSHARMRELLLEHAVEPDPISNLEPDDPESRPRLHSRGNTLEPDPISDFEPDDPESRPSFGLVNAKLCWLRPRFDVEAALEDIRLNLSNAAEGMLLACLMFARAEKLCQDMDEYDRLQKGLPYTSSKMKTVAEAAETRFADPEIRKLLPPSFNSIYELSLLTKAKFDDAVRLGLIGSGMTGADVAAIKGRGPRAQQTGILLWKVYCDEALEINDALALRLALNKLANRYELRVVEPNVRGKRKK